MKKTLIKTAVGVAALVVAASAFASPASQALTKAVNAGGHIFNTDTFGGHEQSFHGTHTTCSTCHINGGRTMGRLPNGKKIPSLTNAAAIFPRYNPHMHKVITLETQIRSCVHNGLLGHPPAYGSQTMVDLVSYLGSLAHGQPVMIGGKPH
ncbi:MAG: c-type cytochrome [Acidiferrobacter sp.]